MADLKTSLTLQDRFTKQLNQAYSAIRKTTGAMEKFQKSGRSNADGFRPMAMSAQQTADKVVRQLERMNQAAKASEAQISANAKQTGVAQQQSAQQTAQVVSKANEQAASSAKKAATQQSASSMQMASAWKNAQSNAQSSAKSVTSANENMASSAKASASAQVSASQQASGGYRGLINTVKAAGSQMGSTMANSAKSMVDWARNAAKAFDMRKAFNTFASGFSNVVSKVKTGVSNIITLFGNLGNRIRNTFNGIRNIGSNIFGGLRSAASSAFGSINNEATRSVGGVNSLTSSVKNLVSSLLVVKGLGALTNMVSQGMSGAVDRYDTLQRYPKVMSTMGFDDASITKSLNRLDAGIDRLPTSLDEIVANTQGLAMITRDLDKATELAIALNNGFLASGKSGADVSRGMQQFSQMLATGEVDVMSWRTLAETMPFALEEVANSLGYQDHYKLYDAMKDGIVTFDSFTDSLIKVNTESDKMAVLAYENARGIRTAWGIIRTAFTKGFGNMLKTFDEVLESKGLPTTVDMLEGLRDKVNSAFTWINAKLPDFIDETVLAFERLRELTAPVRDFASNLGEALSGLWELIKAPVDNVGFLSYLDNFSDNVPFQTFAKNVKWAKEAAVGAWNTLFNRSSEVSNFLGPVTTDEGYRSYYGIQDLQLYLKLLGLTDESAERIARTFMNWGESIDNLKSKMFGGEDGVGWLQSINDFFGSVRDGFNSFYESDFGSAFISNLPTLAKYTTGIFGLGAGYKLLGKFGLPLLKFASVHPFAALAVGALGLGAGVLYAWENVDGFAEAFEGVYQLAKNSRTFKALQQTWRDFGETASRIEWGQVLTAPAKVAGQVWDTLKTGLGGGINLLEGLGQDVVSSVSSLFSSINWGTLGVDVVTGIGDVIGRALPLLGSATGTLAGALVGAAGDILGSLARNILDMDPEETLTTVDMLNAIWTGTGQLVAWTGKALDGFGTAFMQSLMSELTGLDFSPDAIWDRYQQSKTQQEIQEELKIYQAPRSEKVYDKFDIKPLALDDSTTVKVPNGFDVAGELYTSAFKTFGNWVKDRTSSLFRTTIPRVGPVTPSKNAVDLDSGWRTTGEPKGVTGTVLSPNNLINPQLPLIGGKVGKGIMTGYQQRISQIVKSGTASIGPVQAKVPVEIQPRSNQVPLDMPKIETGGIKPIETRAPVEIQPRSNQIQLDMPKVEVPTLRPVQAKVPVDIRPDQTNTTLEIENPKMPNIRPISVDVPISLTSKVSGGINFDTPSVAPVSRAVSSVDTTPIVTAQQTVTTGTQAITADVGSMQSNVVKSVGATFVGTRTAAVAGMGAMVGSVTGGNTQAKSSFNSMGSNVTGTTSSAMSAVGILGAVGMGIFSGAIGSGMTTSVGRTQSGTSSMVATVIAMQGAMFSAGLYSMMGLAAGINAGAGAAISAARSVANAVSSTITSALRIASPSRVLRAIGKWIPIGLGRGMLDKVGYVEDSVNQMIQPISSLSFDSNGYSYADQGGYAVKESEIESYRQTSGITVEVKNKQLAPQISINIEDVQGLDEEELVNLVASRIMEELDIILE